MGNPEAEATLQRQRGLILANAAVLTEPPHSQIVGEPKVSRIQLRECLEKGGGSVIGKCAQFPIFCLTRGFIHDLCTGCVQEGGFEGPENGLMQRRINNRLLSYRP